jgi:hypothetical protein
LSYHGGMMAGAECGMGDWRGSGSGASHSLIAVAADTLGMTQAELIAALQADHTLTIAKLTESRGIKLDTIVNAFLAPHNA